MWCGVSCCLHLVQVSHWAFRPRPERLTVYSVTLKSSCYCTMLSGRWWWQTFSHTTQTSRVDKWRISLSFVSEVHVGLSHFNIEWKDEYVEYSPGVMPSVFVICYRRFEGVCCLHLQGSRRIIPWRLRQHASADCQDFLPLHTLYVPEDCDDIYNSVKAASYIWRK
jgi:hypothetical protein